MKEQSTISSVSLQRKHPLERRFTMPIYHRSTYLVIAERPDRSPGNYGDLVGIDRDKPVRYEYELYDVFDQFMELR